MCLFTFSIYFDAGFTPIKIIKDSDIHDKYDTKMKCLNFSYILVMVILSNRIFRVPCHLIFRV